MQICPGRYRVPDPDGRGVIVAASSGTRIDLAGVTLLSGDVTTATPDEIRAMTVIATIPGGTPAFCADQAMCARSAD